MIMPEMLVKNKSVLIFRRRRKKIRESETEIIRETGITQETETPETGTAIIRAVQILAIPEVTIPGTPEVTILGIQEVAIPAILAMEITDIRI